jgi:hypothetical protein
LIHQSLATVGTTAQVPPQAAVPAAAKHVALLFQPSINGMSLALAISPSIGYRVIWILIERCAVIPLRNRKRFAECFEQLMP